MLRQRLALGRERLELATATKRPAGTVDEDGANVGVVADRARDRERPLGEREVDRVLVIRPFERDVSDAAVLAQRDSVGRGVGHRADILHDTSLSTRGSPGSPSTRSPRMLRMMSVVPPPIDVPRVTR